MRAANCIFAAILCVGAASGAGRSMVGYYPSWICGSSVRPDCDPSVSLAQVSSHYTHVLLAFAEPDFAWNGASWTGSGLQFRKSPAEMKPAIAALRARGARVLLAVGGATYLNWAPLAAEADKSGPITKALADAVTSLGIDGLDVDYETDGTAPAQVAEYAGAIRAMHRAVQMAGPDKILTLAAWSTGADCTLQTGHGPCGGKTSSWPGRAGRERLLFRNHDLFRELSMVSVMAYDAGTDTFDPDTAYALYRDLLPSSVVVNLGFEIAPEGWGNGRLVADRPHAACPGSITAANQFGIASNNPYALDRLIRGGPLAKRRNSNERDGVMLWHILKDQDLPQCGAATVLSPREFETRARAILDGRDRTGQREAFHDP
jgi:hypothetical protein